MDAVLAARQRAALDTLAQAMQGKRYLDLVGRLTGAALNPPLVRPRRRSRDPCRASGTVPHRGEHAPDEDWHRWRIEVKRARYATEAVKGQKDPRAQELARFQDLLGEHQDAASPPTPGCPLPPTRTRGDRGKAHERERAAIREVRADAGRIAAQLSLETAERHEQGQPAENDVEDDGRILLAAHVDHGRKHHDQDQAGRGQRGEDRAGSRWPTAGSARCAPAARCADQPHRAGREVVRPTASSGQLLLALGELDDAGARGRPRRAGSLDDPKGDVHENRLVEREAKWWISSVCVGATVALTGGRRPLLLPW